MVCNMGKTDRMIRAVAGVVLLILALAVLGGTVAWIAGLIGVVMLGTSAVGFCPAYLPFKIKT